MPENGSRADNSTKDSFLGLYVTPSTKRRIKREAEAEGVSISEAVRRRLKDTGGPKAATA